MGRVNQAKFHRLLFAGNSWFRAEAYTMTRCMLIADPFVGLLRDHLPHNTKITPHGITHSEQQFICMKQRLCNMTTRFRSSAPYRGNTRTFFSLCMHTPFCWLIIIIFFFISLLIWIWVLSFLPHFCTRHQQSISSDSIHRFRFFAPSNHCFATQPKIFPMENHQAPFWDSKQTPRKINEN